MLSHNTFPKFHNSLPKISQKVHTGSYVPLACAFSLAGEEENKNNQSVSKLVVRHKIPYADALRTKCSTTRSSTPNHL